MFEPKIVTTAKALGQKWAGIPGIEITANRRLFVVCFSGGEREPDPANTIYLLVSDDGGESFSKPIIMAGPRDGYRAFDPTLWLDPKGRLWLIFNRGDKEQGRHGVFARICNHPDDPDLPVRIAQSIKPDMDWGAEFQLHLGVPYAFRMNKPTVLRSGDWALPVTHCSECINDWFAGDRQVQGMALSRDQGASWTLYGAIGAPSWALENMVIEREDGTVVTYIRAGGGFIYQSLSRDGGLTWSPAASTTIPNPGSRFFIRRLATGSWLLINSPDPTSRTGIAASLSHDEGTSWQTPHILDPRENVSYPDAAITPDGTIYAVHDRDRGGKGEILLTRFSLSNL